MKMGAGMAEQIGMYQLAVAYLMLVVVFFLAMSNSLRISRELVVATLRMTLQLFAAGLLLKYVFKIDFWLASVALIVIMIAFAVTVVLGRLEIRVKRLPLILFASMGIGSLSVLAIFIFLVIGREPWYDARYVLPLGGMIIGNSMTACALVTERFIAEVIGKRDQIETSLALGATYKEASMTALRTAYRAALVPTIASMTGMGIVHLPGMMTGQILSGVEPMLAVKYQVAIIAAILAAAALSSLVMLNLLRSRLFNKCHQIERAV